MDAVTKIIPFYGREIKLRIGTFAPQAGGSVLVQCGETAILVTATRGPAREGVDFVPLLVDTKSVYMRQVGFLVVSCVVKVDHLKKQL